MAFQFSQGTQQQPTLGTGLGTTGFGSTPGSTFGAAGGGTPGGGFTFAQPTQQPSLFGNPQAGATAATGGLFGTPAAAQPKSLFGASTLQTSQAPSLFSSPATTTQMTSLFGSTPTATTQTSLFGAPSGGAPQFNLGSTVTSQAAAPSFGFGAATSAAQPTTTAAAPTFSFGQTPAPATSAAPSFGFGTPASTTTGTATTSAPSFGFGTSLGTTNFGFGSNAPTTTSTATIAPTGGLSGLLGAPTSAPATLGTTFTGLGGVSNANNTISSLGYATGTGIGKGDTRTGKEALIPLELTQLTEELRTHMRSEKILLAEITKRQDIPVDNVSQQIEELKNTLNNITRLVCHQTHAYDTFVKEMNQVQKDLEMAIECNETPPHLRRELVDTTPFYERLLERYSKQLKFYEREAERVIEVFRSGCDPEEITARELFTTLQSTNDTVMALAAKVQNCHEKVSEEITAFRNLQRMILGESKFVEEAPVTASAISDVYNRMYEKANVYFSPNIEASGITNFLHNQSSPAKGATSPTALTSTPLFQRNLGFQASKLNESTPFNYTSGYGSPPSLFQTQTSAILNSQLQSPTGQANTSLKRSKR